MGSGAGASSGMFTGWLMLSGFASKAQAKMGVFYRRWVRFSIPTSGGFLRLPKMSFFIMIQ